MARPYHKIRCLLHDYDMLHPELAEILRISNHTMSRKLNAHVPWTCDEMYAILDRFGIPHSRMHEYFPQNGQNEAGAHRARKGA